jgi:hypothetical protein
MLELGRKRDDGDSCQEDRGNTGDQGKQDGQDTNHRRERTSTNRDQYELAGAHRTDRC